MWHSNWAAPQKNAAPSAPQGPQMDPMGSTDSNSLSLGVEETSIYVVKMPILEPDTIIHLEMVGGFNWMMNQIFTLGKCFFHHFHPLKNGGF